MTHPFTISTRPEGTWAVDVGDAGSTPVTAPDAAPPDAEIARWYASVRPALAPHLGDRAALSAVGQLLLDELAELEDPKRASRTAQIAAVRGELQRFVAALQEQPAAFEWQGTSTGGLAIDPRTGKTSYVGGQTGGLSFFPNGSDSQRDEPAPTESATIALHGGITRGQRLTDDEIEAEYAAREADERAEERASRLRR